LTGKGLERGGKRAEKGEKGEKGRKERWAICIYYKHFVKLGLNVAKN
jgi:hypothetical protein